MMFGLDAVLPSPAMAFGSIEGVTQPMKKEVTGC
jgi:hypothetical protein